MDRRLHRSETAAAWPPLPGVDRAKRCQPPAEFPGPLATPSVAEVASLAVRRCYEGLQSGRPAVSVRDVAALLKLQREIERDDAVAAAAEARARAQMFQKGLASTLWTAKRHIDPARWRARRPSTRTPTSRQDWRQWP